MYHIRRLIAATRFSWQGLRAAYASEAAIRLEALACVILLPLALIVGNGGIAKALLVGSILLVVIAELANTAIETVVERISSERHPLSGMAKDIGSAMVFVAVLNAAITWALVLLF